MRYLVLSFLLGALVWVSPTYCLALEVVEGVITTQVRERQPVDAVQSISASTGKLYCFTRIAGAAADDVVYHVWYRGAQETARIPLPVRSPDWRTWSVKSLLPESAGDWRVEVIDANGAVLSSIPFVLL